MNISESEKKRLQSLKEKKQAFKAKEQFVQQALRNLDTVKSKKIIFDDDINEQQSPKLKRKRDLFDSDDDKDNNNVKDPLWNQDELSIEKNTHRTVTLGNDARFTLDDRFVEDDHQIEKSRLGSVDECDLQKEKERQLNILESVLGAPLPAKNQKIKTAKKGSMIRYDPTETEHREYELKLAQPEIKQNSIKKKKQDKPMLEIMEHAELEPEVSKDIYYSVSNTLTESLKQKEEFSLLKTYGKGNDDTANTKDYDASIAENRKAQKFKFNFNANNAFKYDSSDDENMQEASNTKKQMIEEAEGDTHRNNLFGHKDTLFFDNEDIRFNEAVKFFSTEAASNNEFNKLRRELKTIVRKKILRNEKKRQPIESLKQKEEFSLLRTYGKENDDTVNNKDYDTSIAENSKAQKFKFNFNANNAFKYDSSDDENMREASNTNKQMIDEAEGDTHRNNLFGHNNTLFFDNKDIRFNETVKFFSTEAASNNEFNKLRRELKIIVRKKILRNEKKRQLIDKKRKIRR